MSLRGPDVIGWPCNMLLKHSDLFEPNGAFKHSAAPSVMYVSSQSFPYVLSSEFPWSEWVGVTFKSNHFPNNKTRLALRSFHSHLVHPRPRHSFILQPFSSLQVESHSISGLWSVNRIRCFPRTFPLSLLRLLDLTFLPHSD